MPAENLAEVTDLLPEIAFCNYYRAYASSVLGQSILSSSSYTPGSASAETDSYSGNKPVPRKRI